MIYPEQLKTALDDLGPSWQTVAATLVGKKCKGLRRNSLECPIAQYIRKELNVGEFLVFADAKTIAVGEMNSEGQFSADIAVTTPAPVVEFMEHFDIGGLRMLAGKRG